jgi:small-conductance mechanosensitive channel
VNPRAAELQGAMSEEISAAIDTATEQLSRLTVVALAVIGVIIAARLATSFMRRLVWRRVDVQALPASTYVLINNTITVVVVIIATTILLALLGATWASLVAALSISTLAVVLGLQDLLKSLLGGAFIIIDRPFEVGDRIKVRDISGEVVDLRVRTTILRGTDGARVALPNSMILTDALTNLDEQIEAATLILVSGINGDPSATRKVVEGTLAQEPSLASQIKVTVESMARLRGLTERSIWGREDAKKRAPGEELAVPLRIRLVLKEEDANRDLELAVVRRIRSLFPEAVIDVRRGART